MHLLLAFCVVTGFFGGCLAGVLSPSADPAVLAGQGAVCGFLAWVAGVFLAGAILWAIQPPRRRRGHWCSECEREFQARLAARKSPSDSASGVRGSVARSLLRAALRLGG